MSREQANDMVASVFHALIPERHELSEPRYTPVLRVVPYSSSAVFPAIVSVPHCSRIGRGGGNQLNPTRGCERRSVRGESPGGVNE